MAYGPGCIQFVANDGINSGKCLFTGLIDADYIVWTSDQSRGLLCNGGELITDS
jgi:hypothetical protein